MLMLPGTLRTYSRLLKLTQRSPRTATIALCLSIVSVAVPVSAQQLIATLPDAPSAQTTATQLPVNPTLLAEVTSGPTLNLDPMAALTAVSSSAIHDDQQATIPQQGTITPKSNPQHKHSSLLGDAVDSNGNPIPLEKQQPKRILGFMPNFRTVSAGAAPHPLGWGYNFNVATHQAFDYSSFLFLGLTSLSAEGLNEHPTLGKSIDGFYAYTWRGFIDKTDGTYLSAWLLPSLLHEDTRYYPLGHGHPVTVRILYVISRQAVAETYGGRQTPNIAGLGGKVLTQFISRYYYPANSSSFGVLAEKFGYSVMRDVAFSSVREFYPDIAAHYIKRHRAKAAAQAARDAQSSGLSQ